ncbi:MAG TPA: hypothetical protein VHB93_02350 [Candidatus Paceibacterota bacterium]|nr:hypothetical protein [Candidatus Paceibacterota bacterium]
MRAEGGTAMKTNSLTTALDELGFGAVLGLGPLEDSGLAPGNFFHVPGEEVTYAVTPSHTLLMGAGHIGLGHLQGFSLVQMPDDFLTA